MIIAPKRLYPQKATWWARNATDSYGNFTFRSPVLINVRWEEKNEMFRNRAGDEEVSAAIVYVDRKLEVGDYLILGESKSNTPMLVSAMEVKKYSEVPDIRSLSSTRKVML